jgi:uncharacterized protein YndB with AHSA1/START domain
MTTRSIGNTKTQGWEVGVRRTLPVSAEKAWKLLMTQPGLGYWLGTGVELPFRKGDTFTTSEGTYGEIRSYNEGSLIRMRWQPREWDFESTLQIRVTPAKTGATISFHHERMRNGEQRAAMRQHWTETIDKLASLIAK